MTRLPALLLPLLRASLAIPGAVILGAYFLGCDRAPADRPPADSLPVDSAHDSTAVPVPPEHADTHRAIPQGRTVDTTITTTRFLDSTKVGDTVAFKRWYWLDTTTLVRYEVIESTWVRLPAVPFASLGVANGLYHLPPDSLCTDQGYTALTLNADSASLTRKLEHIRRCKGRVLLLVKRSATKDATGSLSAIAGSKELNRWPDIGSYVGDGTILAIQVGDDITAAEFGPVPHQLRLARLDSMALTARTRWPGVAVSIRAKPVKGELADRVWRWVTTAHAQYRGPYRDGHPKRWADSMVAQANRLKLGIIIGHNPLDGGCGPPKLFDGRTNTACLPNVPGTGILGTYSNAASVRRYQSSIPEILYYKTVFLTTPGNCASIDWQWSPIWVANRPAAQLAAIQGFHRRPEVRSAAQTLAVIAKSKPAASCIHPDRR